MLAIPPARLFSLHETYGNQKLILLPSTTLAHLASFTAIHSFLKPPSRRTQFITFSARFPNHQHTHYQVQKTQTAPVMKTYLSYSFILAAAASSLATGQTAYTTPVGYVSLGDNTAGQPAIKAGTDSAISIPLNRATEFAGEVASVTATTITVSGSPAWATAPQQWAPNADTPYLISICSGTENGFVGLITSNTANTLTIQSVTMGSLTNVAATDKVKIYKAWTLITLFPSGTFTPGVRLFGFSGITAGINLAPDLNYLWNGTNWTKSGVISNKIILYSGESFFVRTLATAAVQSLTISGEVPTSNSRTIIDKITAGVAQDTRLAYISPVDEPIGSSGLSSKLTPGDRLFGFNSATAGINKAPSDNVLWNGTNWTLSGAIVNTTYTLKSGKGYFVRRLASAPVGSADWKDQPSYIPSL